MQTFMPYADFYETARVLDYRRLGKQRCETKQILECLLGTSNLRWKNHPAVKMWTNSEAYLAIYGIEICTEWRRRGYKDTLLEYFEAMLRKCTTTLHSHIPYWIGNEDFHNSHKSNLLRKNKEYYSEFEWDVPDNLEYIWPIKIEKEK